MNIYVTSLGSNEGKTFISAGIAAVLQSFGYKTGIYKPIQTGAIDKGNYLISPDLAFVKLLDPFITTHCTYMMKQKAVPLIASNLENIQIKLPNILKDYTRLTQKTETLITEAPANLLAPINDNEFSFHIPKILSTPIVIVVNPSSEAIGQYLSEINTAKSAGLDVVGVIINKFSVYSENVEIKTFPQLIEKYSDAKVLGLIRTFKEKSIKPNTLINEILNGIDIEDVFRMKISKINLNYPTNL